MMNCCTCTGEFGQPEWQVWTDHPIRQQYEVVMDLGEGGFGQVVLAKHKKIMSKYMALKVVFMENPDLDEEHKHIMRQEATFLRSFSHPSIVTCEDVVDNARQMVLVMEYLKGGQLLDDLHLMAGEIYTEQQAATIFKQIADAVAYMHRNNVIHRDMKPENVVFACDPVTAKANPSELKVKIIDLGMAMHSNKAEPVRGALGSPGFVAPEIVLGAAHEFSMDVYAMGVILFVMLVGRKPFNVKNCEDLSYSHMELTQAPGLQDKRWLAVSQGAKDAVLGMLAPAQQRWSADQVLDCEWVATCGGTVTRALDQDVARGAANVASMRRLRDMANGAVAVQPAGAAGAQLDSKREFQRRLRADSQRGKSLRDKSGGKLSRVESMALRVNAAAAGKLHDSGRTADPAADISVHYKPTRYNSVHGGSAHGLQSYSLGDAAVARSALLRHASCRPNCSRSAHGGSMFGGRSRRTANSMRGSSSSAAIADLDQDNPSWRRVTADEPSGRNRSQMRALRSMSGSMRDVLDASLHGGRSQRGGSREGSQSGSADGGMTDAEGVHSNRSNPSSRGAGKIMQLLRQRSGGGLKGEGSEAGGSTHGSSRAQRPARGELAGQQPDVAFSGPSTIQEHPHEGRQSIDAGAAAQPGRRAADGSTGKRVHRLQPLSDLPPDGQQHIISGQAQ